MSIFIFEDDLIQAQNMKRLVEKLCEEQQISFDFIEVTSKAEELIAKIPQCTYCPIYFLDIEIKKEQRKGLELAKEIRRIDSNGIIVFVTTHSELAPISYQYMVSALTFIDKNDKEHKKVENLKQCLAHYVAKNSKKINEDVLLIENAYTKIKIPFQAVEYIMTDEPHRLKLKTINQFIQFYGTLKEVEQIDKRLIRCHKSYVVNESQVQALDVLQQQLVLKSGKTIPVSRRMMKTMKAMLKER